MLEISRENATALDVFYLTVMSYNIMMNAYPALLAAAAARAGNPVCAGSFKGRLAFAMRKGCTGGLALVTGVLVPLLVILAVFPVGGFTVDMLARLLLRPGIPHCILRCSL